MAESDTILAEDIEFVLHVSPLGVRFPRSGRRCRHQPGCNFSSPTSTSKLLDRHRGNRVSTRVWSFGTYPLPDLGDRTRRFVCHQWQVVMTNLGSWSVPRHKNPNEINRGALAPSVLNGSREPSELARKGR